MSMNFKKNVYFLVFITLCLHNIEGIQGFDCFNLELFAFDFYFPKNT